jgi:hypothetical protein
MSPKLNSSSKIYNGLSPKISQAKALARFSPFCYAAQYYVGMFTVAYDYMSGSSNGRRQFIVNAGAWFVGAALARPFSALAGTNSNLPGEPVWTVLSHYGGSVQIFGGSVIGFLGGKLPKLTKVRLARDPTALKKSKTFPLSPVYAAGNLIEYEHLESLIQIEQLPVESYRGDHGACRPFNVWPSGVNLRSRRSPTHRPFRLP